MAKSKEKIPEFDVTIMGKIKGFNIATREESQEIRETILRQSEELEAFRKHVKELQAMMNAFNSRIERLESFLRSFR